MNALILFVAWLILLVASWPLALLALVAAPFVLLFWLPLKLVGIVLGALFAFVKAVLFLPARLIGYRG